MADERMARSEMDWLKTFPWLRLFRTFLVALDPFKLLVAAAGILATTAGWYLLSVAFYNVAPGKPNPKDYDLKGYVTEKVNEDAARLQRDADYTRKLNAWRLRHRLAGPTGISTYPTAEVFRDEKVPELPVAGGRYRTLPWFEDRGPNPVSIVKNTVSGTRAERSETIRGFLQSQVFVLVEPLIKFLSPVSHLFDPAADTWTRIYLVALLVWLLVVWGFFGGVITRMAISSLAGKETGGLRGAVEHVRKFYPSYLTSPIVPVGALFAIVLGCIAFGLVHLIPVVGDLFDGVFWFVPLGAGFLMTLLVLGLVGYPLMYTTLSAEGSDTFDALSRSYNYVFEAPWSYLWYSIVSILYGAVLVFFVVVVVSMTVFLAKWGVNQTILTESVNRNPDYLYSYAPTSFGWRQLLLEGSPLETFNGEYVNAEQADAYRKSFTFFEVVSAGMVSFWLTAFFLVMLGFSYSYFWTAASMVYLLMRKKVDETEIDEIYLDDDEMDGPAPAPAPLSPLPMAPSGAPTGPASVMVDPPTLKVTPPLETPKPQEAPKAPEVPSDAIPPSKY